MALSINTNLASLSAQTSLGASQASASKAMERLSSGLRINSASDDAAGLAIASRFTSQINGMNQAIRNGNDGISLLQTAEGALTEATSMLQRMRDLAVQSANTTLSASDRTALQSEVSALTTELNRISSTTKFNNVALLDGTFTNKTFQVGTGATDTVSVSISSSAATSIGVHKITAINGTDHKGTGALSEAAATAAAATHTMAGGQTVTISGSVGSSAVVVAANASAKTMRDQFNAVASSTGVTVTAQNRVQLDALGSDGTVSFTLGDGAGNEAAISATVTTTDLTNLASAINNTTGTHGVTASITGTGEILLENSDGDDIDITDFANTAGGVINATAIDEAGNEENTAEVLTSGAATDSLVSTGFLLFKSDQSFSVKSSVAAGSNAIVSTGTTATTATATYVSAVNVGSQSGATAALDVIDGALDRINAIRGDIGALQNRFEFTVSNLQGVSENLSAAKGRIVDADFASETAELARSQILQQAGISVLAQANAQPQNVLALLQ